LHKLGLFCFCGFLFSGYGNDLSIRLIGNKAYLSIVFGAVLPILFLGCGTALRGLQTSVGKCWAGFVLGLLCSGLFSMSRAESLGMMEDYLPKIMIVFFYCCAFALTLRNCRTLIATSILCTSAILLSAALYGAPDVDGRFNIPDSMFFGNSNDLALSLICGLGFSLFLIWQSSIFARILGTAEFLLALLFVLKTGSRGGFVALSACLPVWFLFSNRRGRLLALAIPAVCLLAVLPGAILSRLVEIAVPGTLTANAVSEDTSAASQFERTELFKKSVRFAVTHPVFGTGPGTFMDALYFDDVANSTHTAALGTHNGYTQVASECGFPVFFLYVGVIVGSIRSSYRVVKRTRGVPGAENVLIMSLCLLGSLVAYAVGSAFDHVAFSMTLPVLSGITAALDLASRGGDPQWIATETAAGNV